MEKVNTRLTHLAESVASFCERSFRLFDTLRQKKEETIDPIISRVVPRPLTANCLTIFRVILGLAIPFIALEYGYQFNFYLIVMLLAVYLSDFLDGPVARVRKELSLKGALLDRLADRGSLMPLAIIEYWSDQWLVAVGVSGTLLTILIAYINYRRRNQREVPANVFGKIAMIAVSIGVFLPVWPGWWGIGHFLGWLSVFLCTISLTVSAYRWKHIVNTFESTP